MQNYFKLPQRLSVKLLNSLANKARTYTHLFGDKTYVSKVSDEQVLVEFSVDESNTIAITANYVVDNHVNRLTSFSVRNVNSGEVIGLHRIDSTFDVFITLKDEITKCVEKILPNHSLTGQIILLANALANRYFTKSNTVTSYQYKRLHVSSSFGISNMFEFAVMDNNFFFVYPLDKDTGECDTYTLEDLLNVLAYNFIENGWLYAHVRYELGFIYNGLRYFFNGQENIKGLDMSAFFEKLDAYVEEEKKGFNNGSGNE